MILFWYYVWEAALDDMLERLLEQYWAAEFKRVVAGLNA